MARGTKLATAKPFPFAGVISGASVLSNAAVSDGIDRKVENLSNYAGLSARSPPLRCLPILSPNDF